MYSIINTYFARTKEIFYLNIFHLIIYLDNSMQFFSNKCDHEGANFVVLNGFRTHITIITPNSYENISRFYLFACNLDTVLPRPDAYFFKV